MGRDVQRGHGGTRRDTPRISRIGRARRPSLLAKGSAERHHPHCFGSAESTILSKSAPAAATVASGPVILKNQRPLGACTIAPMRRDPGTVGGPAAAPGILMGRYTPARSIRVTAIPLTLRVACLG